MRYNIFLVLFCTVIINYSSVFAQNNPTDRIATTETKALYRNIKLLQGDKIMFGHQDDTYYGIAWWGEEGQSDVKKVSGDYPAVYGWDIGHLELGNTANLDSVPFDAMRRMIISAYERGGVNTISWHLNNPVTGGGSWDVTSDKVVASVLPKGKNHKIFLQWLDRVANFMLSLKTDDGTSIPVLFRPFHEHTGSWFWWGKGLCSKEDYIALWHFTVNYLKEKKGVHNLLYVYSPDLVLSREEYFDRYPGDKYIDILGLDLYHRDGQQKAEEYILAVQKTMKMLSDYSKTSGKPFVFSETGSESLPMKNWFTDVLYKAIEPHKPVYVLVWRNAYNIPNHFYAPYPGHPSCKNFIEFKNLPDILFESELPNMYK